MDKDGKKRKQVRRGNFVNSSSSFDNNERDYNSVTQIMINRAHYVDSRHSQMVWINS